MAGQLSQRGHSHGLGPVENQQHIDESRAMRRWIKNTCYKARVGAVRRWLDQSLAETLAV